MEETFLSFYFHPPTTASTRRVEWEIYILLLAKVSLLRIEETLEESSPLKWRRRSGRRISDVHNLLANGIK